MTGAISASFADFRIVKGRKVAQLIFETPLEAADEALRMLGGLPRPDAERWVGIAPLVGKPEAEQRPAPEPEKVKEPVPFLSKPRSQQAAIRINDPEFRKWWNAGPDTSAEHVNADIKRECGVTSKRELNTDRNAAETWSRIEEAYFAWRKANRPVETEERA